eukprot:CCRYP_000633-RA/>CCRYP_000633-RA protein AED:0.20 eAED:0.25 QI:569/0/0.33/1/0/0/3/0/72
MCNDGCLYAVCVVSVLYGAAVRMVVGGIILRFAEIRTRETYLCTFSQHDAFSLLSVIWRNTGSYILVPGNGY